MISDIEQKLIDQIQDEESLEELVHVVKASKNPCFLQSYAISYNWDSGYDVPNEIVSNKACDLLIKKLTNNYFIIGQVSYKPSINKVDEYKYKKAGVPSVLFNEVQGVGI